MQSMQWLRTRTTDLNIQSEIIQSEIHAYWAKHNGIADAGTYENSCTCIYICNAKTYFTKATFTVTLKTFRAPFMLIIGNR